MRPLGIVERMVPAHAAYRARSGSSAYFAAPVAFPIPSLRLTFVRPLAFDSCPAAVLQARVGLCVSHRYGAG